MLPHQYFNNIKLFLIGPDDLTVGDKDNMKKELSNEDQTVLKEISKDNKCTIQDHMKTSIGVQAFEILQIIKDEDFQDNLEENMVDGIDREEKTSKDNRCTVQDHMEASIIDEDMEILQSDKVENWNVQDNLEKNSIDGSNYEEKISKDNKCTVQDPMEASILEEGIEILQSVEEEDWNLQDNLDKTIVEEIQGISEQSG